MEKEYMRLAPDTSRWPGMVAKMRDLMLETPPLPEAQVRAVRAPTLLLVGDADLIRPEHAVELFHLLGGARPDGGMAGPAEDQLAILPGTTHFTILYRTDLLMPILVPFLDGTPTPTSGFDPMAKELR